MLFYICCHCGHVEVRGQMVMLLLTFASSPLSLFSIPKPHSLYLLLSFSILLLLFHPSQFLLFCCSGSNPTGIFVFLQDTRNTIKKICEFLGENLESGELELVLKNISFQIMKERMISQSCLSNVEKHEFIMRKGRDILYF